MEKTFDFNKLEPQILEKWEKSGSFTAKVDPNKEPFTIILPPPNANGRLHMGHVLMLAIEDILIRWKKMQGYSTLWVPGTDHAGFETQIVFEKHLRSLGESRFNYDSETLYKKIWDFVEENKTTIIDQLKSMGPSLDWSRYSFTLDDHVIKTVYNTFEKMIGDDLIYRDDYIVNFCPKCGTTFADLEIKHEDRISKLYYIKYGPLIVATTRPETKFGDVALAVHPDDERYTKYVETEIDAEDPLGKFKIPVIADNYVDSSFGTGVLKITPAHDKNDYEIGIKHNLKIIQAIGLDGRMMDVCGKYKGMTVNTAREELVKDLQEMNLIEKVDENYNNSVALCYKGDHIIEPTVLPNWFVKVETLKKPALDVVKKGEVKIYPKWQEITYIRWMEEMHDWPISRQVVWGIRIPAWYDIDKNPDLVVTFIDKQKERISGKVSEIIQNYSFEEIESGLQNLIAPKNAEYVVGTTKPGARLLQETDTFDTWFSSGQWPLVTLHYPDSEDYKYFYPTSVMETGWEIVRFWVSRMIMFGIYLTGKPPFKDVYLHGLVRDQKNRKMSKSLGNVVDPADYIPHYGADALRMGLISGTANGKDFAFPADRVKAYRNFGNKLWNMARFMNLMIEEAGDIPFYNGEEQSLQDEDKKILESFKTNLEGVNESLKKYRFSEAAEIAYHFMWDELASIYIEHVKTREDRKVALSVFRYVFTNGLKMLHPFMPFVTEAIWENIEKPKDESELLVNASWPK